MLCRILDTGCGSLRDAEQYELPRVGRIGDRLQVRNPPIEGEITDLPIRHSASALVVADETEVC